MQVGPPREPGCGAAGWLKWSTEFEPSNMAVERPPRIASSGYDPRPDAASRRDARLENGIRADREQRCSGRGARRGPSTLASGGLLQPHDRKVLRALEVGADERQPTPHGSGPDLRCRARPGRGVSRPRLEALPAIRGPAAVQDLGGSRAGQVHVRTRSRLRFGSRSRAKSRWRPPLRGGGPPLVPFPSRSQPVAHPARSTPGGGRHPPRPESYAISRLPPRHAVRTTPSP
jgi:hypothetical protein